jgi:carboxypeptidase Q
LLFSINTIIIMPHVATRAVRSLLILSSVLVATASRVDAQTFPTADPVLKRIYAQGMDSSQVMRLGQVLLDSLGPRLTGTEMQKAAGAWVAGLYKSWGMDARQEKVGTWRGWRRGYSHIDLVTPRVRTLEGTMLAWSPGTNKKDVVAETIILPRFADSTEFVKWLPQVRGKFVMASAAMPTCRPTENWTTHATPESKERMDSLRLQVNRDWAARVAATGHSLALGSGSLGIRLEQAGAAGVVTSRPKNAWGTIDVFESYNTRAPAVALSCEDYGLVYRLTENNQKPTLRINADAELLGEQPIFNTIGIIKGSELPNEYVLLSAHFDSFDGGSGATDNGTGTLTMLEAMRILSTVYPRPKRTILVGHWTAEEHGLVGSRAFSEDHPEIRDGLQALFNQDAGTGRIQRVNGGGLTSGGEHLVKWMAAIPTEMSSKIVVANPGSPSSGGSDDASFGCWGLPAFGMGGVSWDYGSYTWHTNRDTYDKVVFDDLRHNATLTAMLAYLASESPTRVGRERATDEQRAAGGRGGRGGGNAASGNAPTNFAPWPTCQKAPRVTNPRLR